MPLVVFVVNGASDTDVALKVLSWRLGQRHAVGPGFATTREARQILRDRLSRVLMLFGREWAAEKKKTLL